MRAPFLLLKCIGKALLKVIGGGFVGDLLVETLPEIAKESWDAWSKEKDREAQRREMEAIVQAGVEQIREQVAEIKQAIAPNSTPEIQLTLESYLTQVPAMVRKSLRRPSDPTGTTVSADLVPKKADDLLAFLPPKLPRFKRGDRPLVGVDWELEELLGVGGFGEVWKARNPHMTSAPPVALKFCLDATAAKVLRNEAAMLDRVMRQGKHPGIVQLQHTYLSSETPCLEYEYVEGGELAGVIHEWHRSGGKPKPEQAAKLILQLAEIVGFAHRQNPPIVHRDLKPSNILVKRQEDGEIGVKVADFGIGGVAASRAIQQTRPGTSRGELLATAVRGSYTPLYASPQQVRGEAPDPRDDVFALGVIWYQLLTGDLATGRPGGTRWHRRLTEGGVPSSMVDILAACFEENPEDRPADGGMLADELARLPCSEATEKPTERLGLDTIPLSLLSNELGLPSGNRDVVFPNEAEGQIQYQLVNPRIEIDVESVNRDKDANCATMKCSMTNHSNKLLRTIILDVELAGVDGTTLFKGESQINNVASGSQSGKILSFPGISKEIGGWKLDVKKVFIHLEKDGKTWGENAKDYFICTVRGTSGLRVDNASAAVPKSQTHPTQANSSVPVQTPATEKARQDDAGARLFKGTEAKIEELIRFLGHKKRILSVTFSPDGKMILSTGEDETVHLWNAEDGKELWPIPVEWIIRSSTWSADGHYLLLGGELGMLLLEAESGDLVADVDREKGESFQCVALSNDNRFALGGMKDNPLLLWRLEGGKTEYLSQGNAESVSISPVEALGASGHQDGTVQLWDLRNGKQKHGLIGHSGRVQSVAFSPQGDFVVSGGEDKTMRLWDIQSGKEVRRFTGHSGPITTVAFSLDGRLVVSDSFDNTGRIWDVSSGRDVCRFTGHRKLNATTSFSTHASFGVSGFRDGTILVWKVPALLSTLPAEATATPPTALPSSSAVIKSVSPPKTERQPGDIITDSLGMTFAWIPPGTFLMGRPKDEEKFTADDFDDSQHEVTLTKGFYMGVHPVTQAQWQTVMGTNPSYEKGEKLPVEMVSWNDCQEFIKELRTKDNKPYRLPTESEWEYACRAGTATPYYFGETVSTDQANCDSTPVGSFPANAWGLHDMHGNVCEWCQDWIGDYQQNDVVDPEGPRTGQFRVVRGGSWFGTKIQAIARSASRMGYKPGETFHDGGDFGFRLCFCLDEDNGENHHRGSLQHAEHRQKMGTGEKEQRQVKEEGDAIPAKIPPKLRAILRKLETQTDPTFILQDKSITDEWVVALAASPHLEKLKHLNLTYGSVGAVGAAALAASPYLAKLQNLGLYNNQIGDEGAIAITSSASFANLAELDLSSNGIGDKGAMAFVQSSTLSKSVKLGLSGNNIGDAAMEALLDAFSNVELV